MSFSKAACSEVSTPSAKTSTPKVYLRAKVAEGQAGIKVRGDWIAVKTQVAPPNYKVDSYEMALKPGMNNVTFSLSAPTAGWPEGEYRVDLFIDGKPAGNVPFRVSK